MHVQFPFFYDQLEALSLLQFLSLCYSIQQIFRSIEFALISCAFDRSSSSSF
ncbi:hypothetical protein HanPSC8_Chr03g0125351 [Helianthus annuus]|nr:hypothetical protein HanPSC8_Chr03g0125351 [Helianthus annuus]